LARRSGNTCNWFRARTVFSWAKKTARYTDQSAMTDSVPARPWRKLGSLVEGRTARVAVCIVSALVCGATPGWNRRAYQLFSQPEHYRRKLPSAVDALRRTKPAEQLTDCWN